MSRGGGYQSYGAVQEYRDDPNYKEYTDAPGQLDSEYNLSQFVDECNLSISKTEAEYSVPVQLSGHKRTIDIFGNSPLQKI